jgi:hypothetical protein
LFDHAQVPTIAVVENLAYFDGADGAAQGSSFSQ